MPIVGTVSRLVISAATGAGTASRTTEKAPASSSASAPSTSAAAASDVLPWVLKPPSMVADCGGGGRVAGEDDVDARVLGEARSGRVVGGDHDDLVAALLHRGKLGGGEFSLRGCAPFESPSRIRLSTNRVLPPRPAAASPR